MAFESGVKYYTSGTADIHFPEDKVCCAYCPLMETYARKQCRLTGELLVDDRYIGYWCPIKFKKEEEIG